MVGQQELVTIVTASTGGGHDSVARNLFDALTEHSRGVVVTEVLRLSEIQGVGSLSALCQVLYGRVIIHFPWLWGLVYGVTNTQYCWRLVRWLVRQPRRRGTNSLDRSSVVVSVHPIGTQVIASVLARRKQRALLVALVTDLFEAHAAWLAPEVDAYIAPTPEVVSSLLRQGVDRRKINLLGLPLDRRFAGGRFDKRQERLDRGLEADSFTILITGGGEGAGSIVSAVKAIVKARLPVQLIVACGRNQRLRSRLDSLGRGQRMAVLGFEEDMARMMECADVVVGKAGALTIAEAIVSAKPTIVLPALGGQELGNLKFVSERGLTATVGDAASLVAILRRWLLDDTEQKLLRASMSVARVAWNSAADCVAGRVVELVRLGGSGARGADDSVQYD